jgi:hypothetical protein
MDQTSIFVTIMIWIVLSLGYFPCFVFAHFLVTWDGIKRCRLGKLDLLWLYLAAVANSALVAVCSVAFARYLKLTYLPLSGGPIEFLVHLIICLGLLAYSYHIHSWRSSEVLSVMQRFKLLLVVGLSLFGLFLKNVG